MKIDCLVLGSYQTNSYVVRGSEESEDCLVIDTGLDAHSLVEFLRESKLNPSGVVFTHGHCDHIAGLLLLRESFCRIKVYIHRLDGKMLTGDVSNLAVLSGLNFSTAAADVLVEDGDVVLVVCCFLRRTLEPVKY